MTVEFGLINSYGQEYALTDVNTGFLTEVEGMGYALENSYARVSNAWITISSNNAQGQITGSIYFYSSDVYAKKAEFEAFIRSSKKLALRAKNDLSEKYTDVDITEYSVQAINNSLLQVTVSMMRKTLWYTRANENINIVVSDSAITRYPYIFPSTFNEYDNSSLKINNDGSVPAAFIIEIHGPIANPVITIEQDDAELSRVEITATLSSGQRIIYSSKDGEIYCYKGTTTQIEDFKRTGNTTGMTNLTLSFSLLNENFVKAPVGLSKLKVSATGSITNPIFVEAFKLYREV